MSPLVHNAAFEATGEDRLFVPLLVEDAAEFLSVGRPLGIRGFSITIPHKEVAVRCVDEIDPVAGKIGAINTIVVDDNGMMKGYNTDWNAAITAIEDVMGGSQLPQSPLKGKTVVVIGAGGAGRALAFGAIDRQVARVVIVNRTEERALKLVAELTSKTSDPSVHVESQPVASFESGAVGAIDVIINTTSIGMHPNPDATPVPPSLFANPNGTTPVVFDAVYNPLETRLLREARSAGCATVTGLEMFVRQAVQQFELWTGRPAPKELMQDKVLGRLQNKL
eukprot:Plantae.Rhodophyta-Rhodochaete_pulchella.ctg8588.p1 GENE.Plantae.Rhodophyta-Rhodochaete_pulchella.ctg8588~~Plantae.Rhodophyta-Rhodochaete_pulchella.ctg8588.p1  ORF type:complete len:313 (+),score=44.23 Plantae.Rhodophyta-Rhodochaete_pulchella.ctg8588:102-941(+)